MALTLSGSEWSLGQPLTVPSSQATTYCRCVRNPGDEKLGACRRPRRRALSGFPGSSPGYTGLSPVTRSRFDRRNLQSIRDERVTALSPSGNDPFCNPTAPVKEKSSLRFASEGIGSSKRNHVGQYTARRSGYPLVILPSGRRRVEDCGLLHQAVLDIAPEGNCPLACDGASHLAPVGELPVVDFT